MARSVGMSGKRLHVILERYRKASTARSTLSESELNSIYRDLVYASKHFPLSLDLREAIKWTSAELDCKDIEYAAMLSTWPDGTISKPRKGTRQ